MRAGPGTVAARAVRRAWGFASYCGDPHGCGVGGVGVCAGSWSCVYRALGFLGLTGLGNSNSRLLTLSGMLRGLLDCFYLGSGRCGSCLGVLLLRLRCCEYLVVFC
jgi:hypothetical protein